jgi:UDP-3-O-[3-hydroxymyristoyl] glucosamine N-acyltransferase
MKLKELARSVSGVVLGDGDLNIKGIASPEDAKNGDIVCVLEDSQLPLSLKSSASALVVSDKAKVKNRPAIVVRNPRLAFAQILVLFAPKRLLPKGIHKTAVVPASCKLGKNVAIGAFVVLGEKVVIGDNSVLFPHVVIGEESKLGESCILYPHVSVYERVSMGQRVIIHAGARIGIDGFGFVQQEGKHIKIPQIGSVVIEDDVEIYANTCVARGTLGKTIIGQGTKIDSLTHVAHNCRIGKDCAIVSLVGIAGSVTLGNRVYVGGQAGFKDHVAVGEKTIVMARAGVTKDLPASSVVSGFPAQDHHQEMSYQATLRILAKKTK